MSQDPYTLKGKTILITGASSGIGRAIAVACSARGAACCVLVGRRREALEETASMLAVGDGCVPVIAVHDLSDTDSLDGLVVSLPEIDGLVLNAGTNKMKPLQFYSGSDIENIFGINCFSPVLLLKQLVKKKKLARGGSVVFMSSISGHGNVSVGNGIYGASKSAVTTFMEYAALELAPKSIRCNSVHPGRVETPLIMNGVTDEETVKADKEKYPLKRYGRPEEVAHAVVYLLSDAAAWVTGSSLVIDGGRSLV